MGNADEEETASNASYSASPAPPHSVSLPDDLIASQDDLLALLGVDVDLARPTSELLFTAYRALLGVQEDTRAEIVRKEVELEQVIQDHESRVSEIEARLDESGRELEDERKKNSELGEICVFCCCEAAVNIIKCSGCECRAHYAPGVYVLRHLRQQCPIAAR